MDQNNTFLSTINYAIAGVGAHFAGAVVEIVAVTFLPRLPYGNFYKVPVAKVLHEFTEGFFSASTTINMLEEQNNFLEALQDITKPIWNTPGETIVSAVASFLFEYGTIKMFSLRPCNHHEHHHSVFAELWSASTLIKGLASAVGSFIGAKAYHIVSDNVKEYAANQDITYIANTNILATADDARDPIEAIESQYIHNGNHIYVTDLVREINDIFDLH